MLRFRQTASEIRMKLHKKNKKKGMECQKQSSAIIVMVHLQTR